MVQLGEGGGAGAAARGARAQPLPAPPVRLGLRVRPRAGGRCPGRGAGTAGGGSEEANSALFLVDVKKKTKGLNDVAPTEALGKGFYQGVNWK